jgi:hypothetical protein
MMLRLMTATKAESFAGRIPSGIALKALVELGWVLELQGKPIKYRLNANNAIMAFD